MTGVDRCCMTGVVSLKLQYLTFIKHWTLTTSRRKLRTHSGLILIDLYMFNKLLTKNTVLLHNLSCCPKSSLEELKTICWNLYSTLGATIRVSAQVPANYSICSGGSGGLIRLRAKKVSYLTLIKSDIHERFVHCSGGRQLKVFKLFYSQNLQNLYTPLNTLARQHRTETS